MLSLRSLSAPAAIAQRRALSPTPPRIAGMFPRRAQGITSSCNALRNQQSVARRTRRASTHPTLTSARATATSMLDASSSSSSDSSSSSMPPPPLAMLAGVNRHCLEVDYGGRKITIETGEIARQANGSVVLTDGETILLATACATPPPPPPLSSPDDDDDSTPPPPAAGDGSFVPLQVHYSERFSAAGRTTGSFFKRDGRPKDGETLVARLVDRPLRPCFEPGWCAETQVLLWVLSYDGAHSPEPLAITAAGAALAVSDIPLSKAVAGARVALLPSDYDFDDEEEDNDDDDDDDDVVSSSSSSSSSPPPTPHRARSPCGGWLVANPTVAQASSSSLDLVLAGTATAVMMIEGYCSFLTDDVMVAAVELGAAAVAATASAVDSWAERVRGSSGVEKRTDRAASDAKLLERVREAAAAPLAEVFGGKGGSGGAGKKAKKTKEELSSAVDAVRRRAARAVGVFGTTSPPPLIPSASTASAAKLSGSASLAASAISGGDGSGDRKSAATSSAAGSDDDDDDVVVDDETLTSSTATALTQPSEAAFNSAFKKVLSSAMRSAVLDSGIRSDGRGPADVRPIAARAGLLPRTHGSALFTRGETQALAVTTLGSSSAAQRVDSMSVAAAGSSNSNAKGGNSSGSDGESGGGSSSSSPSSTTNKTISTSGGGANPEETRAFYLQYFFPPCSVGETGRVGAPGRREVGHGTLAERALAPAVPAQEEFPYTVRVESTITESNGSSSMASVCGGCLSMLDAGVPLRAVVAGVAMGLILKKNDDGDDGNPSAPPPPPRFEILTDILGSEDALGDMDFKVAGDGDRVTAFQMDVKVDGITPAIISAALAAARDARRSVLASMERCSPPPRRALGPHSPRIELVRVPADRLGAIIGPGGKTIRAVRESSGCDSVNVVSESAGAGGDGTAIVELCDASLDAVASAKAMILAIAVDPAPGSRFPGSRVHSVERFGLIVEFVPGRTGLAHVSELPPARADPESYAVGERVDVVLLEGGDGRYKLSLRAFGGNGSASGSFDVGGDGSSWASSSSSSSSSFGSSSGDGGEFSSSSSAPPPPPRPPPPPPLQPIEVGAIFRGASVRGVQPFGVFFDLGGNRSGLCHASELSPPRPADPSERYSRGDRRDVVVIGVEGGRVSLSERKVKSFFDEGGGSGGGGGGEGKGSGGESDEDVREPGTPRRSREAPRPRG